ncbi:hypothetical protein CRE_09023 [Caenorhabditis remanei]|uniref:Uncharacterized protein n=1 Tax=Caenorhabditis remanei TaxID=31234 RepID=E3LIU9_CAERE|nr:hypothetical protein CRE_09023 [Caenorhabditis remanei]
MFSPLLTILAVIAITAYSSSGVFRYSRLDDSVCDTFNSKYVCSPLVKIAISFLGDPDALRVVCGMLRGRCSPEEMPCSEVSAEDLRRISEACGIVTDGGTTSRPSPTEEPEHTTISPPTGTTEDNSIHTTGTPPTGTPEPEEPPHTTLPDPGIPDSDHTTASPPTGTTEDNSIHTTGTPPTPTPETEEPPHTILPDPGIPACTSPPPTTTTRDPNAPPPTQVGYVCGGPIDVTNMPN